MGFYFGEAETWLQKVLATSLGQAFSAFLAPQLPTLSDI